MKNLSKLTVNVFSTALIAEGLENISIEDIENNLGIKYNDNQKRRFCALHDFKLIEIPYTDENLISYDYIMEKAGY